MEAALLTDPLFLWGLAAALAHLALALAVFVLDPAGKASRALAIFLAVEGTAGVATVARIATGDVYFRRVEVDLNAASGVALAWFVVRARVWLGVAPARRWHAAAAVAGLALVALISVARVPLGPHHAIGYVAFLSGNFVPSLAALVLGRDGLREERGSLRAALLLLAVALALRPLFHTAHLAIPDLMRPTTFEVVLALVATSPLSVLAWAAARAARAPGAAARPARMLLFGFGLDLACVAVLALVHAAIGPGASIPLMLALMYLWLLSLPVLTAFAVLRHRVFGVDPRARLAIRHGTTAAVAVSVVFVASESAATFLSDRIGTYTGILAVGLLLAFLAPLQRVGSRVAERALPPRDAAATDRGALYRDQAVVAWADGSIDRSDRALLDHLRERLGLTREEAARIESEAAGVLARPPEAGAA